MAAYPYSNDRDLIARALIVRDGHILVNQNQSRKTGEKYVALPGGHVDPGEDCVTALVREIMEELAGRATVHDLLFVAESVYGGRSKKDKSRHELTLVFSVEVAGLKEDNGNVLSPESDKAFKWLPLAELPETNLLPATVKAFILGNDLHRYAFSDTTK